MRFLVISDLHGDLTAACEAVTAFQPDVLLSCGDWGDSEQVSEVALAAFPARLPVYTTFGNHDPFEALGRLRNHDGSLVLLSQGTVQEIGGLRIAAIGGIAAKRHRRSYHVTDAQVAAAAQQAAGCGPIDLLLTHSAPYGLADRAARNQHGGQVCFRQAFDTIRPCLMIAGHLHIPQEESLRDGRTVMNVGLTPRGSVILIDSYAGTLCARPACFAPRPKPDPQRG